MQTNRAGQTEIRNEMARQSSTTATPALQREIWSQLLDGALVVFVRRNLLPRLARLDGTRQAPHEGTAGPRGAPSMAFAPPTFAVTGQFV